MFPFVLAHALPSRQDLPIPVWLFAWAVALVLIASFFALAVGWREPRLEADRWRPLGGRGWRALLSPAAALLGGLVGVGLLALAIYAGLRGTEAPERNFALTFFFVTCWLGFPIFSFALGDVFRFFNPWRAIGRAVGAILRRLGLRPRQLPYPERLGRWPAAIGVVGFVWLEIVYGSGAGVSVGVSPHAAAVAALGYSAFTLAMMALFGVEQWCRRGETFSVYFGMFASFGLFEARGGRLGRRRALTGPGRWVAGIPGSLAVVAAAIGTTAYDGAAEGVLAEPISWLRERLVDLGFGLTAAARLGDTIFLVLCVLAVAAIYLTGVHGMRRVSGAPSLLELRDGFAHTLIPIAFAYLLAHYFSLFVFQEQAQFTYLLSDPLGTGTTDLFGTASAGIDYGVLSTNAIWYVQVFALATGHVLGLVLAHDRATAYWGDYRLAARSQYWMLAVMVLFTCVGLYFLSVANE